MTVTLYHGDCLDVLPTIEAESIDCVITDPPYPHIKRDYGTWTTEEWWALMVEGVIPEVRRILKPTGSAVFILQPNSEHVGQMRGWLFEFQAWVCREWNMVQDAYWWDFAAMPTGVCIPPERGLMRASLKPCVWCGEPSCYRDQGSVLWQESQRNIQRRTSERFIHRKHPSGQTTNRSIVDAALERGGVIPFNVLPIPNANSTSSAGANGHGAGTPLKLADWWVRYICPPGGTVLDPFVGSGTMMLAAIRNGCNGIGIERVPEYHEIAQWRVNEAQAEMVQAVLL